MNKFRGLVAVCAAAVVFSAFGTVYYAAPEGAGDGSSWDSPASASVAIGKAANGDEVWLKSGEYKLEATLASSAALTIRGGFEGKEESASERVAGVKSVLDGGFDSSFGTILSLSATSGTVFLDGLVLSNSYTRAVDKSGAANAVVIGCTFTHNGLRPYGIAGRGGYWMGEANATLAFTNCVFSSNYDLADGHNNDSRGAAGYFKSFNRVTMHGCTVVDCGIDWSVRNGNNKLPGRDATQGYVIYSSSAPLIMTHTRVAGNVAGYNRDHGGLIYIDTGCEGTRFVNCSFVGNHGAYFIDGGQGGVIRLADGCSVSVDFCTFAYNVFPKAFGAGILLVKSGEVNVSNTIFWGNVCTQNGIANVGADVYLVNNAGTVTMSYCLVGGATSPYLWYPGGAGERIQRLDCLTTVDPAFATSLDTFKASLTANATIPYNANDIWFSNQSTPLAFDVHLRSYEGRYANGVWVTDDEASKAIDAGNPASSYDNEPTPNGACVNLGAYGNTDEASKTKVVQPTFEGEVTVDNTHDYTRPHFFVALKDSEFEYVAKVELAYATSQPSDFGETQLSADWRGKWETVDVCPGTVGPGAEIATHTKGYYQKNTIIWWRLAVSTSTAVVWREGSVLLDGDLPPEWGHGGDASVVHVWAGGSGCGDGSSWIDACLDMASALELVTETRTNIWIAGTVPSATGSMQPYVRNAVMVLGGFTGVEDSAGERPLPVARAIVTGNDVLNGCIFEVPSGAWTVVRDVDFMGQLDRGIQKSGEGSLGLYNVDIRDNARNQRSVVGRGLYAVGDASKSELVLSNVVVSGNAVQAYDTKDDIYKGAGLNLQNLRLVRMTDVEVLHNGIFLTQHDHCPGRDVVNGGAVFVHNAPILARNVSFVGNNAGCNGDYGNVMHLSGNCGGSVFENCRWVGNEHCRYVGGRGTAAGALTIALDQDSRTVALTNCTIAFNLSMGACAGLRVKAGTVIVRNSIFAKNVMAKTVGASADIHVTGGALDIDYSLLMMNAADYITQDDARVVIGSHMTWGDPLFETGDTAFLSGVNSGAIPRATSDIVYFKNTDGADMRALNVHLKSYKGWTDEKTGEIIVTPKEQGIKIFSQAIDAGDPKSARSFEPTPNGGCVNLGCYGNTPYASRSGRVGLVIYLQ